jgi:predicted phosphodiesterase
MRLALISDLHGNSVALDAVLADIDARGGVDHHWVLGDLVALGPDPIGVLERISTLRGVTVISGNTDRYVVTGDRPPPSLDDATREPGLVPVLSEVSATFAWTAGSVHAAGWMPWLAALPTEVRATLPDGTRLLGVHASPGRDDGPGVNPYDSGDELLARLDDPSADVVFAGHTHWPVDRVAGSIRAVNLGSISNPLPPDLRASYVLVEANAAGHTIEHARVEYDHDAVITQLTALNHPGRDWLIKHQRGEVKPRPGGL